MIDELLGDKLVASMGEGKELDMTEFTFLDKDIRAEHDHLTVGMLTKEIDRLEDEAVKVEAKLQKMTLRERAEWEKYYPVSLQDIDEAENEKRELVEFAREIRQMTADGEFTDEDEENKLDLSKIDQMEAEMKSKERMMLKRYAEEIREEGFDGIPQEKMEEILEEIIEKDGLENEDLANEYFDMQWQRLEKMKFNEEGEKPRQPQFLDIDPVRGAPYHR